MSLIKTERELAVMRPACIIAQTILDEISDFVQPGQTTRQIDEYAALRMRHYGVKSAFLGYGTKNNPFPSHLCISVNDQVVHGIASERRVNFGDIISIDCGVVHEGFIGDTARTVAVGGCSVEAQQLMDVTEQALYEGIAQARGGHRVADISRAVQRYVEGHGYSVVREFVGHGVGRTVHEEPQVPNFDDGNKKSPVLHPGMTIAIEPMVNAGRPEVKVLNDRWTVVTNDGSLSAHFEHTVLITPGEPEILTCRSKTPFASTVS